MKCDRCAEAFEVINTSPLLFTWHHILSRADAKATDSTTARRPSVSSTDSFRMRGRDSARRGRGSSDDEAAAKPMARRTTGSPTGYGRAGIGRRGSFDAGTRCVDGGPSTVACRLKRCLKHMFSRKRRVIADSSRVQAGDAQSSCEWRHAQRVNTSLLISLLTSAQCRPYKACLFTLACISSTDRSA